MLKGTCLSHVLQLTHKLGESLLVFLYYHSGLLLLYTAHVPRDAGKSTDKGDSAVDRLERER